MIEPTSPPPDLSHADLAGLWESAGSERAGHSPGSERYHFPVAGTLWIEHPEGERLDFQAYQLDPPRGLLLGPSKTPLSAWIEAGFLILRDAEEHETWCRRVTVPRA
jgi:hypothetical protein